MEPILTTTALAVGGVITIIKTGLSLLPDEVKEAGANVGYNLLSDGFKLSGQSIYKKIKGVVDFDIHHLNHDLQKASAKAQLRATIAALDACLAEFQSGKNTVSKSLSAEINWCKKVEVDLIRQLKEIEDGKIDLVLVEEEVESIFRFQDNLAESESNPLLIEKLKKSVLANIKNSYYSQGLLKFSASADSAENPFELLEKYILYGWQAPSEISGNNLSINIQNYNLKKFDWFSVVCQLFNEEYKTNLRVKAAIDKLDHSRLTETMDLVSSNLEVRFRQFSETFETISSDIGEIKRKLSRESGIIPALDTKEHFVNRDQQKKLLRNQLLGVDKKVILLHSPNGSGKNSLVTEVISELAPNGNLTESINAFLYFDCAREGVFERICRFTDEFLDLGNNGFESRYCEFTSHNRGNSIVPPTDIIEDLIDKLGRCKNVWLYFRHLENLLENGAIKNPHLNKFFARGLKRGGIRFLLAAQVKPIFLDDAYTEQIRLGALTDDSLLQYFRERGEHLEKTERDIGLSKISFSELSEIKELGINFTPAAAVALCGYLISECNKREISVGRFLQEHTLVELTESTEGNSLELLIKEQFFNLSQHGKLILQTLAFIDEPVSRRALSQILSALLTSDEIIDETLADTYLISKTGDEHFYLPEFVRRALLAASKSAALMSESELYLRIARYYESTLVEIEKCSTFEQSLPYLQTVNYFVKANDSVKAVGLLSLCSARLSELGYPQNITKSCELLLGGNLTSRLKVKTLLILGSALETMHEYEEASKEYAKAGELLEIHEAERSHEDYYDLARLNVGRGVIAVKQLNYEDALEFYEQALRMLDNLPKPNSSVDFMIFFSTALINRGAVLEHFEKFSEAVRDYNQAIEVLTYLKKEGVHHQQGELGRALMSRGITFIKDKKFADGLTSYGQSIEVYEQLVGGGQYNLQPELALAYLNYGIGLTKSKQEGKAQGYIEKTIDIFENFKKDAKHFDLSLLAKAHAALGTCRFLKREYIVALRLYDNAILIYEDLTEKNNRFELLLDLSKTYEQKGQILKKLNKNILAIIERNKAFDAENLFNSSMKPQFN